VGEREAVTFGPEEFAWAFGRFRLHALDARAAGWLACQAGAAALGLGLPPRAVVMRARLELAGGRPAGELTAAVLEQLTVAAAVPDGSGRSMLWLADQLTGHFGGDVVAAAALLGHAEAAVRLTGRPRHQVLAAVKYLAHWRCCRESMTGERLAAFLEERPQPAPPTADANPPAGFTPAGDFYVTDDPHRPDEVRARAALVVAALHLSHPDLAAAAARGADHLARIAAGVEPALTEAARGMRRIAERLGKALLEQLDREAAAVTVRPGPAVASVVELAGSPALTPADTNPIPARARPSWVLGQVRRQREADALAASVKEAVQTILDTPPAGDPRAERLPEGLGPEADAADPAGPEDRPVVRAAAELVVEEAFRSLCQSAGRLNEGLLRRLDRELAEESGEAARVVNGDPAAAEPGGVLYAAEGHADALRLLKERGPLKVEPGQLFASPEEMMEDLLAEHGHDKALAPFLGGILRSVARDGFSLLAAVVNVAWLVGHRVPPGKVTAQHVVALGEAPK
jgi:hypothetical protein